MTTRYRIVKRTRLGVGTCPPRTTYIIQFYRLWHWWNISGGYYDLEFDTLRDAQVHTDKLLSQAMPTIDVVED